MDPAPTPDLRLDPRTNIFVVATLYGAAGSTPVRIRNMSPSGALIEGAVLPTIGSEVNLCRGSLSVTGRLVWIDGCKAGLRFAAHVAVAEWLPNAKPGSGQQLADELLHQARLGAKVPPASAAPQPARSAAIHDELMGLCRSLQQAGEDLAADAAIAERHPGPLQAIDMAAQALAKLADAHGGAILPQLSGAAAP